MPAIYTVTDDVEHDRFWKVSGMIRHLPAYNIVLVSVAILGDSLVVTLSQPLPEAEEGAHGLAAAAVGL